MHMCEWCVYMYVHMQNVHICFFCTYVQWCMSTNAWGGGQGLTSEVFLNHFSPCKPLQWGLLLNLEVTNGELGRLARSGDSLSLLPEWWDYRLVTMVFQHLSGSWESRLARQAVYPADHLPAHFMVTSVRMRIFRHAHQALDFSLAFFLSFCFGAFWKTLSFTSSPHFPGVPLPLASPLLSRPRLTLLCYCSAHLFSSPLSTPLCVLTQSGGSRTAFLEKRIQGLGKCISEKDRLHKYQRSGSQTKSF